MSGPAAEYERRLAARRASLAEADARHFRLGIARIGLVVATAILGWFVWGAGRPSGWWIALPAAGFLTLGHRMRRNERDQSCLGRAIRLYETGLERLADRWSGTGPEGAGLAADDHPYARDLDLFGEGSLFQLLCAARTGVGRRALADWLLEPATPDTVRERQRAVDELATDLDLREDLAVLGDDVADAVHPERLRVWGERPPSLAPGPAGTGLAVVGSVAGLAAVFAAFAHLAAGLQRITIDAGTLAGMRIYVALAVAVLGFASWHLRHRIAEVLHGCDEVARELDLMAGLLERLETARFEAPLLAGLRAALAADGEPPSRRIERLRRLMQLVDSRDNFMVRLFGPLVLWDVHVALALQRWRARSGTLLRGWVEAVGAVEALSSFARLRHERPEATLPEMIQAGPVFDAEGLGHPLLPRDRLVRNDVALGEQPRVLVVSGSNMSGKSTLLRTIGTNAVLAQAGAPVCAARLRLSPLAIGASIRLQDSLREGTSRFYAEILRLRQIVGIAAGPVPALFLVDEFLHGTNSHDRRAGAAAIVLGLVERGAIGLITTHDLALAGIADELGAAGANVHFADELADGRMRFDYRLREGVVQKSNAIELMRSVGLDV